METQEGIMQDFQTNRPEKETILVIHHDAAVLVLVKGILAEGYRVLLAADADSAVRLAMLADVPMDLALIGRETPGVSNSRMLQRRLTSVRPNLQVMSMIGSVDEQVIKIRTVGIPKERRADDFLTQVRGALGVRRVRHTVTSNSLLADVPSQERRRAGRPSLVARAGSAVQ